MTDAVAVEDLRPLFEERDALRAEVARLRLIEAAARSLAGTDEACESRLLGKLENLREVLKGGSS